MYGNPKYRKDTSSDLMLKPKKWMGAFFKKKLWNIEKESNGRCIDG
jgi:hypothetical protein